MESDTDEEQTTNNKKNKKEKLFSFGKINKYFIIPFLCPVCCMLANYFIYLILQEWKNSEFPLAVMICFTYILGGLFHFVSSIRTKTEETRENARVYKERVSSAGSIKYIYNDGLKKNKCIIFGLLIVMTITLSFFSYCDLYSEINQKHVFDQRMFFLFFIPLFSKIILKDEINSHQILSLLISFIGMIFIFVPNFLEIETNDIIINILSFIAAVGFSLFLVLVKLLTHNYYLSPYLCLLFLGLFSLIATVIYYLLYSLILNDDLSIITNSFDFSEIKLSVLFYTLGVLLFGTLLQDFTILVVFYFSPTLLMVTDIISPMLTWIVLVSGGETLLNNIFYGIGYLTVLFGSLIYNEIIICNFYGLNKNTKKCLEERQRKESALLRKTENEIKSGKMGHNGNEESEQSDDSNDDQENENENDKSKDNLEDN